MQIQLTNIRDLSYIDFDSQYGLKSLQTISYDGEIGGGGFAKVYKVNQIDGTTSQDYLVKIISVEDAEKQEAAEKHAYETIRILHEKLRLKEGALGFSVYNAFPELLGMPFMVFKATNSAENKKVVALLLLDLKKLGFVEYDENTLEQDTSLTLDGRFHLAYQLTKAVSLFHELDFIHSDLKEANLFIHIERRQVAIIDYDSGFNHDQQERPSTKGSNTGWAYIKKSFGSINKIFGVRPKSREAQDLEEKEVGFMVNAAFEFLFDVIPFFFLSDFKSQEEYLNNHKWPEADFTKDIFNSENKDYHTFVINNLENLKEQEVSSEFYSKLCEVLNQQSIYSAAEWRDIFETLLNSLDQKPELISFNTDKKSVKKANEKVKISFKAKFFDYVKINGQLISPIKQEITLPIADSTKVQIEVCSTFGITKDEIEIQAIKVDPVINRFIASDYLRKTLDPVELHWNVENASNVAISGIKDGLPSSGSIEVDPKVKTRYTIEVVGHFGQKVNDELWIETIKPEVKHFDWEINIEEDIRGVEILWDIQDATEVIIEPLIGQVGTKEKVMVKITQPTTFKLIAKGPFNQTIKTIKAHPFPLPVVKSVFTKTPIIDTTMTFDTSSMEIPHVLLKASDLSSVKLPSFNLSELNTDVKVELSSPKFEKELLIESPDYLKRNFIKDALVKIKEISKTMKWRTKKG